MKAYVTYLNVASFVIEVDVPDDTPAHEVDGRARELAEEKYPEAAPGGLCHECAHKYTLGDDEQDPSLSAVWTENEP